MNYQELMKLVNAGFTKQEILAITGQLNAEPSPEPAKAPDPVPDPKPVQAPDPVPDPEPAKAPDPVPDPTQSAIDQLTAQVTKLTTLVQRSNILMSEQPDLKQQTAEDIVASIIFPSYKGDK